MTMDTISTKDTFEHKGHRFHARIAHDEGMREPWKEQDGHGIISEWTKRKKGPSERVLADDSDGDYRYYDIGATMKLAVKDGWGLGPEKEQKLAEKLGRKPTKREICAAAVEADYARMRAWCNDEWYWVAVIVTLLKSDDDAPGGYFPTKHSASLSGIDGDDQTEYLEQVKLELADQILSEMGGKILWFYKVRLIGGHAFITWWVREGKSYIQSGVAVPLVCVMETRDWDGL